MSKKKRRILVVEDEEKIRRLLQTYLEPDYELLLAEDGEQAVELVKTSVPDFVFLDLKLPGMDGLSVLRILKRSPETMRVPVVVLSGVGESNSLLDAQGLGVTDYLIKPYALGDLRAVLRRHLG